MERTISRVEVLKGYTSHFLNLAIGLILLPLILKYFDTKTISIWFSFITIGSLIQLFEFGLLPTIIRHISFLAAGSQISNRNQSRALWFFLTLIFPIAILFIATKDRIKKN